MKYFIDTEFCESPGRLDLLSIGIVSQDGRAFYAENKLFPENRMSPWLTEHVEPRLRWWGGEKPYTAFTDPNDNPLWEIYDSPISISDLILEFAPPKQNPEFWGYYSAYDWVAFCQLFGTMMELPNGYPMYCHDIKSLSDILGVTLNTQQAGGEHDALADAYHHRELYKQLKDSEFDILWGPEAIEEGK